MIACGESISDGPSWCGNAFNQNTALQINQIRMRHGIHAKGNELYLLQALFDHPNVMLNIRDMFPLCAEMKRDAMNFCL
jgi:hypothetical protein